MRDKFGKKNPIALMLFAGLVILGICLGACMFLVNSIHVVYQDEIAENYDAHHESISKVLDRDISMMISDIETSATRLSAIPNFDDADIFEIIDYGNKLDRPVYYGYLTSDGYVYGADRSDYTKRITRYISDSDAVFGRIYTASKSGKSLVKIGKYFDVYSVTSELLVMTPVFDGPDMLGQFFGVIDLGGIVENDAYSFLNENGEGYIINTDTKVLGKSTNANLIDSGEDTFANGILATAKADDDSKKSVQQFKADISKGKSGYITVEASNGNDIQISYYKLTSMNNIYFVTVYNENVVNNMVQPLVFRAVLTCLGMMALMIVVILFVWATAKKANITIEKLAYEDPVTKGKNINYFKEFALEVMSVFKETPFVIWRFDISNFRYINEAYGHIKADDILTSCIKDFSEVFSEKELCVRMNADQFLAIVVNDKTTEQRVIQFEKMVNADARSKGIKYPIKFKTGVYQIKKHEHDIDVMIDHANAARKTLNGSEKIMTAYYTENIVTNMRKIDRIESDMQRALATGEFQVYYQPKWDIVADHVAGAEALVRWIRADGSMVYPDEFIPIFEQNGFIEKLDFYVLEVACTHMRELLDKGKTVYPVSVNQSRLLFYSPDYVENVEKIIKKYNIPENAIELEITETVLMDEQDAMIKTMQKLKKVGVRISMDDFGSGYSSLNMLKDAPFDIIKIDREFFSESVTSEISMWILQKIIEMVNGLGIELICEGVENGEQSALLRSIGCRMVQGYFYSKPIPADEYFDRYC